MVGLNMPVSFSYHDRKVFYYVLFSCDPNADDMAWLRH